MKTLNFPIRIFFKFEAFRSLKTADLIIFENNPERVAYNGVGNNNMSGLISSQSNQYMKRALITWICWVWGKIVMKHFPKRHLVFFNSISGNEGHNGLPHGA